ncbi:MAG: acetyl-CoA hydrolase/transferase C-terminal domain-containing protein [Candidatus Hydrogenedentota bacterium]
MSENVRELYERKKTTYKNLVRSLESPLVASTGNASAKAHGFFFALGEYGDHLEEITLGMANTFEAEYPIYFRNGVNVRTAFYGPLERSASKQVQNVSYRPTQFCDGKRFLDLNLPGPDVFVLVAGPMDDDGYFNLGLSASLEYDCIQRYAPEPTTQIAVEANSAMPHVLGLEEFGNHRFHISDVDHVIESDEPIIELGRQTATESDKQMADHVAGLVEDGATLQFGFGALPDMVAERLQTKKGLGIHTEMVGDGCMELIKSGAVTNENKTEHRGLTIATFAWGTQPLYDWLDHNESVRLVPVGEVNFPPVLARQYKMTSINSILQIDLRGQATAHCLNGKTYSGLGGHFEHTFGAQLSPGGKSILCLRSSAELSSGRVSNILGLLAPGTAVTTPEFIVDWVVTEFGAVQLKWLSLAERAAALISIAHPDFREDLEKQAGELNL